MYPTQNVSLITGKPIGWQDANNKCMSQHNSNWSHFAQLQIRVKLSPNYQWNMDSVNLLQLFTLLILPQKAISNQIQIIDGGLNPYEGDY